MAGQLETAWRVAEDLNHGDYIIFQVVGEHESVVIGRAKTLEDATSMAASKQMLEALEMVAKYDRGNWMDRPWSRAVAKAIAKAKG